MKRAILWLLALGLLGALGYVALRMSDERSFFTFRSTRRRSQLFGNKAETVNSPRGGNAHRLPSKGKA